ncbi:MAG: general secretion pathway protein GspB [Pseudomonadota bacterium]
MSYILDALRRAEAQRERGAVPGIHAQPGATRPPHAGRERGGNPLWWALAALAVVAAASLAWFLSGRAAPREVVVAAPPAPVVVAAPAPALPPAPAAVPPPQASPVPAPMREPSPEATLPPAPSAKPAPTTAAKTEAARARAAASRPRAAAPEASAAPAQNAAPAVPALPRIYTREELPGDIRGQLPQVKISGSSWSENPAHRMLIANGQVFHENEKISADLAVEQIRAQAVVLNFRGYRYLVPY